MADDEVTYTRPNGLVALERQANAEPPAKAITHQPGQQVIDNGGYTGVDPVYQNYANETDAPYTADSGEDKAGEDALNSALDRVQADGKTDVEFNSKPRETSLPDPTPEQTEAYKSVAGVVVENESTKTASVTAVDAETVPASGSTETGTEGTASEGTSGSDDGAAAEGAKKQGRPSGTTEK